MQVTFVAYLSKELLSNDSLKQIFSSLSLSLLMEVYL